MKSISIIKKTCGKPNTFDNEEVNNSNQQCEASLKTKQRQKFRKQLLATPTTTTNNWNYSFGEVYSMVINKLFQKLEINKSIIANEGEKARESSESNKMNSTSISASPRKQLKR